MDPLDTESEALEVQVTGEVVLLGPGVAIALSADAAAETARRLAAAAAEQAAAGGVVEPAIEPLDSDNPHASQASSRDA